MPICESPKRVLTPIAHIPPTGEQRIQTGKNGELIVTYGSYPEQSGDILKIETSTVEPNGQETRKVLYPIFTPPEVYSSRHLW